MRGSLNSHKGHFTRKCKAVGNLLGLIGPDPKPLQCEGLQADLDKLTEQYVALQRCYQELSQILVGLEDQEEIEAKLDDLEKDYQLYRAPALVAIGKGLYVPPPPPAAAAAAAPGGPPRGRARINESLKPERLCLENTPTELRSWMDRFRSFFTTSELQHFEVRDQQAFLFSCLSPQLETRLKESCTNATTIFDDNGCMDLIKAEFDLTYPMVTKRLDFFNARQEAGQSFRDFDTKMARMGLEADLQNLETDDIYVFRYITGISDGKLREKFLKLENPTLAQLRQTARVHETQQQSIQAIDGAGAHQAEAAPAAAPVAEANVATRQPPRPGPTRGARPDLPTDTCWACAEAGHRKPNCKVDPSTLKCAKCHKMGHVSAVCGFYDAMNERRRQQKSSRRGNQGSAVNSAIASEVKVTEASRPTPLFFCTFSTLHKGERNRATFSAEVVPDTGATRTIIASRVAKRNLLPIATCGTHLRAANGQSMKVAGEIKLRVNYQGQEAIINALVSDDLKAEVLMSWHDLQSLRVIGGSFPDVALAASAKVGPEPCQKKMLYTLKDFEALKQEMLEMFPEVFCDVLGDRRLKGDNMHIHLDEKKNVVPKKVFTARQVPLHFKQAAEALTDQLVKDGIIVPVDEPTDWISPAHFVPKPNGGVRLVQDYTWLNQYVKRPVHPFPSTKDILQSIDATSTVFAKMDAVHGYYQIPLDHESSMLTTFLLPNGKFRPTVAPMGLNASSDEWCARSDVPFAGHEGTMKLVDDGLTQAPDLVTLRARLIALLHDCRASGITLSRKKFSIGDNVKFAGHNIGSQGVTPDEDKVKAIREFPRPKDVSALRSFLGLANQLGAFVPDLAHATEPLRQLLKKEVEYAWIKEHEEAFQQTKALLSSDAVVKAFDPLLPTYLYTDASRLYGLGFMLMQREATGAPRLIKCGSRSLQPAETRYATVELECLGVAYAVAQCDYYLRGADFTIVTDHRPLLGVFRKDLHEVLNPRLLRLRERLQPYTFKLEWLAGKLHQMADALSRAPVFQPAEEDVIVAEELVFGIDTEDKALVVLRDAIDEDYKALVQAVRLDFVGVDALHGASEYRKVKDLLSLQDCDAPLVLYEGRRVVVPKPARKAVLQMLHKGHCGANKTEALARELYFWPGINNEIRQSVSSCSECVLRLPSQAAEPILPAIQEKRHNLFPMSDVGIDLFSLNGCQYVTMVDRYSGFPFCQGLRSTTTDAMLKVLMQWFVQWGFPLRIRSDGGPQFRTEFGKFCDKFAIVHELSSPHHSQSNGLAEAAVKQVKYLLGKCRAGKENFDLALLEWRNTPGASGATPAVLFLGRRQKTSLPARDAVYVPVSTAQLKELAAKRGQVHDAHVHLHDQHAKELAPLDEGICVHVQNPISKRWESEGKIVCQLDNGRSYRVLIGEKMFVRNRIFLRPASSCNVAKEVDETNKKESWDSSRADEQGHRTHTTVNRTTTSSMRNQVDSIWWNSTSQRSTAAQASSLSSASWSPECTSYAAVVARGGNRNSSGDANGACNKAMVAR